VLERSECGGDERVKPRNMGWDPSPKERSGKKRNPRKGLTPERGELQDDKRSIWWGEFVVVGEIVVASWNGDRWRPASEDGPYKKKRNEGTHAGAGTDERDIGGWD
jgi:hypothetical protein